MTFTSQFTYMLHGLDFVYLRKPCFIYGNMGTTMYTYMDPYFSQISASYSAMAIVSFPSIAFVAGYLLTDEWFNLKLCF